MACVDRMHFSVSKNYKAIANITLYYSLCKDYILVTILVKIYYVTTLYMNWVRKQLFALLESI